MERLADLDELTLRCRTPQAQIYITEAVAAYRAGAFRACIVATWIAVVFDVIDKIREIAVTGDKAGKEWLDRFEKIQDQINRDDPKALEQALRFERDILEIARDNFELLDHLQYGDLMRLREDRHRCAHPTFHKIEIPYQPSAETVRSHLRNAIVHLLQHQPVQGKAALEKLKALVNSEYFPGEPEKIRAQLLESPLARPTDALVRNFVDMLMFGFFEPDNALYRKQKVAFTLLVTVEMHRGIAQDRFSTQLRKCATHLQDDKLDLLVGMVSVTESWAALDGPTHDKLREFVLRGPLDQVGRTLPYGAKIEGLRESVSLRIQKSSADDLEKIVQLGIGEEAIPRAVQLYSEARDWVQANKLTDKIVLPLLPKMKRENIEAIIRAPKEKKADLPGSHGFNIFLKRVVDDKIMESVELLTLLRQNNLDWNAAQLESFIAIKDDDEIPF